MLLDDRNFLSNERQDRLLREAAADRLARLLPRGPRPGMRERVASILIALATRIAPPVSAASRVSLTVHGHGRPPLDSSASPAP